MRKRIFSKRVTFYINMGMIAIGVIIVGIYLGNMIYGKSSYVVLQALREDKLRLEEAIIMLKKDSASLQKEYFELRQLDPDTRRDK